MKTRVLLPSLLLAAVALLGSVTQATAAPAAGAGQGKEVSTQSYSCGYYSGTATFRYGDVGNGVREIQCLINLGRYTPKLTVDGEFGDKTRAAVEWYQRCSHISVDGEVGPNTWYQLRNNPNC